MNVPMRPPPLIYCPRLPENGCTPDPRAPWHPQEQNPHPLHPLQQQQQHVQQNRQHQLQQRQQQHVQQHRLHPGYHHNPLLSSWSRSLPELHHPQSSRDVTMEINNHYGHLPRKDIHGSSPLSSPTSLRRSNLAAAVGGMSSLGMDQAQMEQQLAALKQQQQIQQQMLLQQFQVQQQQLAQEHKKQIDEHIKVRQMLIMQKQAAYLEEQRKQEQQMVMEKEKRNHQRLEQLKHKADDEKSAIASSEVKQKLQGFLLKKQREHNCNVQNSPPQFRPHWPSAHHSSLEQNSPPQSGLSPPFGPLMGPYSDDFPLRKTASEPNLKVRSVLKQKVIERRSSPLLRRRDPKGPLPVKRKTPLTIEACSSNPDSGPNSPPTNSHMTAAENTLQSKEELSAYPLHMMKTMVGQSTPDLQSLYTSCPNISIGKPATPGTPHQKTDLSDQSTEAELRAMAAARFGLPLTGHMLPSTLPFYPSLPVIDGEFTPPGSPAYITSQMKNLEQARSTGKLPSPVMPFGAMPPSAGAAGSNNSVESQSTSRSSLHRPRPLGRTQSAPLPLQHPLLQQQQNMLLQQQHEQFIKENQKLYLKQHIRNTVLQRAGSKNHMENVDEETEAKLAAEMRESREPGDEEMRVSRPELEMERPQQKDAAEEIFVHHREMKLKPSPLASPSPPHIIHHRPLSRTQSSPVVIFPSSSSSSSSSPPSSSSSQQQQQAPEAPVKYTFTTGLAYDSLMLKHQCVCGNNQNHPEHAGRLQSIWARLQETQLVNRCERVKSRKATIEEIQSCHSEAHTLLYGTNSLNRQKLDPKILETLPIRFCFLPCGGIGVDSDTVWNEQHTSHASRMAAGCVIELATRVATSELKNGFAVVRPPGHHAESEQAMGFCYFNSIAIAAKQLRERLKLEKILIIDWDVHHGNSTQQIFYNDPYVLYISLHRHDNGNFFPGTGGIEECGVDDGLGFNVNVAWLGGLSPPMGDAEYLAAFRSIVMPIARDFAPDVVLVSAGFDAAAGHPATLGGYVVSAACFGHMTKELMTLAGGKVVMVLEGGYDLPSICDASELSVQALMGDEIPPLKEEELCRPPCEAAIETLERTIKCQAAHWPCVSRYTSSIGYSLLEAQRREREEADTVTALASLSMVPNSSGPSSTVSSTSESEPMEES